MTPGDLAGLDVRELASLANSDPGRFEAVRLEVQGRPCLDSGWRPGDPLPVVTPCGRGDLVRPLCDGRNCRDIVASQIRGAPALLFILADEVRAATLASALEGLSLEIRALVATLPREAQTQTENRYAMEEIRIADIRTDRETQTCAAVDAAVVADYCARLDAGDVFPPVVVYRDGEGNKWLADGFHRLAAHLAAGRAVISATVTSGTRADAAWAACAANCTHGLRRSNADKRLAVENALAQRPGESDRGIAKQCQISHTFVAGVRGRTGRSGNVATLTADRAVFDRAISLGTRLADDLEKLTTQGGRRTCAAEWAGNVRLIAEAMRAE